MYFVSSGSQSEEPMTPPIHVIASLTEPHRYVSIPARTMNEADFIRGQLYASYGADNVKISTSPTPPKLINLHQLQSLDQLEPTEQQ